ncbi:MAG: cache domain-containing protein [Lachnospiraceae bacterium]|nr:cache domain-containing protein [Lachnospiraceae bacterium]
MAKKISMRFMLILFTLVPLTVGTIIFVIVSSVVMTRNMENNINEELEVATEALKEYYQYDLENDIDLVDGFIKYETDYIDRMKQTGIDFTVFQKDTRFMTTIKDEKGNRIEGTKANADIWNQISSGKTYFGKGVKINGEDYYVCYVPIRGSDGVAGMAFSGKPAHDVDVAELQMVLSLIGLGIALEVVFMFASLLIARKVASPLKAVVDSVTRISEGYTDIRTTDNSKVRETFSLIEASNRMAEMLHGTVARIKSNSEALKSGLNTSSQLADQSAQGADQIAQSVENLTSSAELLANNVQDMSSNIITMGDLVDEVVSNTNNLHQLASEMDQTNSEAIECVNNMANSSRQSAAAISEVTETIRQTNDSVNRINEMVGIITDIAEQTNLLALNASIEAARAGDAGRGFGVVAEEIKHLAEQSNDSASQITDMVSEILLSSERCVKQSESVQNTITEEQKKLATTQEKFDALSGYISTSVTEIDSVSSKAEQLGGIKTVITNAISDLSAISEENAATNEEVSSSISSITENVNRVSADSREMNNLSEELANAVAYFK